MARRNDKEGLRVYIREYMRRRRAQVGFVEPKSKPETYRKASQRFRKNHPEKVTATFKKWCKNNPELVRYYGLIRAERRKNAKGACTLDQLKARIEYYGSKCYVCRKSYEAIDHVIPLAKGGTNWPGNLRPICKSCNSRKHDKMPNEFRP